MKIDRFESYVVGSYGHIGQGLLMGVQTERCVLEGRKRCLGPLEVHTTCTQNFSFYKLTLKKLRHITRRLRVEVSATVLVTMKGPISRDKLESIVTDSLSSNKLKVDLSPMLSQ